MDKGWQGARELTVREREILQVIWSGLPNKEIASLYGISPRTVEHHWRNMMRKWRVTSTAALLRRGAALGLSQNEASIDTFMPPLYPGNCQRSQRPPHPEK
jgi:DNA-binding NarL/FixJ family response regulator